MNSASSYQSRQRRHSLLAPLRILRLTQCSPPVCVCEYVVQSTSSRKRCETRTSARHFAEANSSLSLCPSRLPFTSPSTLLPILIHHFVALSFHHPSFPHSIAPIWISGSAVYALPAGPGGVRSSNGRLCLRSPTV